MGFWEGQEGCCLSENVGVSASVVSTLTMPVPFIYCGLNPECPQKNG